MSPVAVLTGAARGIGSATVDRLVAAGWRVVAVDVCADDPNLAYAMATAADLEAVRSRHGDSSAPWWGTCAVTPTCNRRSRWPSRRSVGSMPPLLLRES